MSKRNLVLLAKEFRRQRLRTNPSDEEEDVLSAFLWEVERKHGSTKGWSNAEWVAAAQALGMPESSSADLIERLAAWEVTD